MQATWLARPALVPRRQWWREASHKPLRLKQPGRAGHSHRLETSAAGTGARARGVHASRVMASRYAGDKLKYAVCFIYPSHPRHRARAPNGWYAGCRDEDVVKDWITNNLDSGKVTKEQLAGSSQWSSAYVYQTENGKKYFVKLSLGRDSSMFKGEALGLQALYGEVRVRDWH